MNFAEFMESMQYIGARYVPKFHKNSEDPSSIEWDANVPYEAITVVSYLGDSYTSKIPVPATVGNPKDNPNYWAKTGEFNAAIEALQDEIHNLQVALGNTNTKVGNLETYKDNGLSMVSDYLFTKYASSANLAGDGKTNIQGCAFNSVTDKILIGLINDVETECTLVLLSSDGLTVESTQTHDNLGHCNDITYNPRTRKYYVCSSQTSPRPQTNTIVEINEDLSYSRTITLDTTGIVGNIAYDYDNNRYIGITMNTVVILDSNFGLVEERSFNWQNLINNHPITSYTLVNGITMFNGALYCAAFKANVSDNGIAGFCILKYDIDANAITETNLFVSKTPTSEIEGLIVKDNDLYAVIGGGVWYSLVRLVFQDKPYLHIGDLALLAGINIPANSDLNDYLTTGKYFYNNSEASSILHKPYANGNATLYVISTGQSSVIQIIEKSDSYPCFCFRNFASGSWNDWRNIGFIVHGGLQEKIQNFIVPAFVTSGGKEFQINLPFGDCSDLTGSAIASLSFTITGRYNGNYLSDGVNSNQIKSANVNITNKYSTKQGLRVIFKRTDDAAFITNENNYGVVCELDATMTP